MHSCKLMGKYYPVVVLDFVAVANLKFLNVSRQSKDYPLTDPSTIAVLADQTYRSHKVASLRPGFSCVLRNLTRLLAASKHAQHQLHVESVLAILIILCHIFLDFGLVQLR